MSIEDSILIIVANFFKVLVIWRFMRVFFSSRLGRYKESLSYVTYFLATISVLLLFQNATYSVIVNLAGLMALSFLYQESLRKKLIVSVGIYMIAIFCQVSATYLFSGMSAGADNWQLASISADLFFYICEILAEKLVEEKGKQELNAPVWMLVFTPVVNIFMLYIYSVIQLPDKFLLLIEGGSFFVVNVLLFLLYYQMLLVYENRRKQEHIEQQMRLYENQFQVMQQSEYKVHALRHDMKHHIQNIYIMTHKNQNQDVLKYLEQMQDSLENPKEHIATGNGDMDVILNYMLEKAEQAGIKVEQKVKVPKKIEVESYELNVILSNLLENAIEAAKDTVEKQLKLNIVVEKGMFVVYISNTYSGKIAAAGEKILSTKGGLDHGYGLKNVENIVKLHQGRMKVTYDEREFQVEVILYL